MSQDIFQNNYYVFSSAVRCFLRFGYQLHAYTESFSQGYNNLPQKNSNLGYRSLKAIVKAIMMLQMRLQVKKEMKMMIKEKKLTFLLLIQEKNVILVMN